MYGNGQLRCLPAELKGGVNDERRLRSYLGEGGVYGQGGLRCLLKLKIVCTARDVFVYYPLGSRWGVP